MKQSYSFYLPKDGGTEKKIRTCGGFETYSTCSSVTDSYPTN